MTPAPVRHRILEISLVALVFCAAGCGPATNPLGPEERQYQTKNPLLGLKIVYPAEWRLAEERGGREPYAELRVVGPRNQEDTYSASMVVRATAGDESLAARARTYQDLLPDDAVVESRAARRLQQVSAQEFVVSWVVPPLFRSGLKAQPIPVKTRTVLFRRGASLYELIYSADAREYDRYAGAFDRLLASLRFERSIR